MRKPIVIISIICLLTFCFLVVPTIWGQAGKEGAGNVAKKEGAKEKKYKVTFVELGSVRCKPCIKMQKVMEKIEKEYGDQVKIVFHDVWTSEGKPYGKKYKIKLIPTQVFLDKDGKEYFRHVGFFPKDDLVKVLKQQGVK